MLIAMQDFPEYGSLYTLLLSVLKNITQCLTAFYCFYFNSNFDDKLSIQLYIFWIAENTTLHQWNLMSVRKLCAKRSWSAVTNVCWTHSKWCQRILFPSVSYQSIKRASASGAWPGRWILSHQVQIYAS